MKLLLKNITTEIAEELEKVLVELDEFKTIKLIHLIEKSKRIFLSAQGRSKLVAEAFAMRLTHLGFSSYIVGEPTTPNITKNDLLIAITGSGKTKQTIYEIKNAIKKKAKTCIITASKIKLKTNIKIKINAKTKTNKKKSIEPLGSLFEQATLLYLDSIIILLMKKMKITEKQMRKRHAKDI